ncbi:Adenylate Cyclase Type 3 [Manis pentadactyla]|nr:Adenylate Cyclase Type 3 [Manis pentadactyla]
MSWRQIFAESDKKRFKNKELGAKISGSGNAGFSGWNNIVCILWHGSPEQKMTSMNENALSVTGGERE